MGETVNTFLGLNQDNSKAKYKQGDYYDALNVEIVTSNGLSTGAITNTKGTKLEFVIPNITTATYEVGSETGSKVIPALSNLEILGWTSYDNIVIVFTGKNGYGQIWKLEYNESTGLINGLSGNSLVQATHMIYNRYLNFQNTHRIKAYVRKESSKFIRLYFNDGLNPFRSFNLANPNPLEIKVRTLDINPEIRHKIPVVQELLNGNLPNCKIGYFFRLLSRDGSLTTFSPISNLIDLNNGNEAGLYEFYPDAAIEFKDIKENAEETKRLQFSSEKACKVLIENIDKDYDYIQVGYVQYVVKDQPEMYIFPEEKLNGNTHLFVHSGNEEGAIPLSIAEYLVQNNTFETFKDFVPKHNELYVANITNSEFDVDYDARVYRYKLNSTNTYVSFPVAEDADAINPYNDENPATNSNWLTDDQYKYKFNNSILGGTGLNVSYEFTTDLHLVDDLSNWIAPGDYYDSENIAPFNTIGLESTSSITRNYKSYPINKSYSDLKSPYKASLYNGYARGEVYRFGLVFVKKNGQKSFVKWIGDIKFPGFDETGFELDYYDSATNNYYVRTLGIKFQVTNVNTIDPNIYSELSHIEIVRVNREEEDKTKLGTGVTGGLVKHTATPMTNTDFNDLLAAMIIELVDKMLPNNGGFLTTALSALIANSITDAGANNDDRTIENLTKDDFELRISNGVGSLGGGTGLVSAIPFFGGSIGNRLERWLISKMEDYFKTKKIAGIANTVYSLDNYNVDSSGNIDDRGIASGKNYAYTLSPIVQFDKYKFRTGDYLKPIAGYEYNDADNILPKLVGVYHRDTSVGLEERTHSTAKYKKWYRPIYYNNTNDALYAKRTKLTIELENTLDIGEILKPNAVTGIDGVIANCYIGTSERYKNDGTILGFFRASVRYKVQGIGDKKHFVKVGANFPGLLDAANQYTVYDQQNSARSSGAWGGLIYGDDTYYTASYALADTFFVSSSALLKNPGVIDASGNFLVSYERYVSDQYGGNTYVARSLNKYLSVAVLEYPNFIGSPIIECYGGDTYVGLYDTVNYAYYMEQVPGYDKATKTKKAMGELFPAEAPFNFNVREGKHFNVSANADDLDATERRTKKALRKARRKAKRGGLDFQQVAEIILPKRFLYDDHEYYDIYHQHNSVETSFPEPVIDIFTDTNTNRIYKSNGKIDGELIDNWKQFKPNNFLDVEGVYGPINALGVLKDRLYFYQSNAIGVATTNERATAATSTGTLALGDSVSLSRYDYISVETGSSHQFGVVATDTAIFHFDVNTKKLFQLAGGLTPISDVEGLASYFRNNLTEGSINVLDQTLTSDPSGIHGIYDNVTNRVYFTFLNKIGGVRKDFTINYNLLSKSFESFHSFTPGIYLRSNKRLYSVNPALPNEAHQHKVGNYNNYYGALKPSLVNIIINENPQNIKTFDNHLIFTEVTDINGVNLVGETISNIECYNDYQNSGVIPLVPNTNIKRMDRKWHLQIPRDAASSAYTSLKARLSDTNMFSKLVYDNPNNRKMILHDIYTFYRESIT